MKEFKISDSENSDTAHATSDEKRNPAEMNPLLLTITHETQKEIDNNIEKKKKFRKRMIILDSTHNYWKIPLVKVPVV